MFTYSKMGESMKKRRRDDGDGRSDGSQEDRSIRDVREVIRNSSYPVVGVR